MSIEKINRMTSNETITYEGGKAYGLSFIEQLAEFFCLGLLNGNFYQSEEEVLQNARELYERAMAECPEFATKAAIYGNNFNSLKLVPTIWLVYLSTLDDKTLFKKAFPRIIRNPKMLYDFMEIARKSNIRTGLGRSVKKTMNEWLFNHLNEYQASRNKGKLAEIIKVTRPSFQDETFQNYMKYIAKDELTFDRAIALKEVIQSLQSGQYTEEDSQKVFAYRLQLEELKHSIRALSADDKKRLYYDMYNGLNYAALILNLVALERVYATKTEKVRKYSSKRGYYDYTQIIETVIPDEVLDMVSKRIKDIDMYRKSNMLPFALLNAEKMVATPEFKSAIADVFKIAANEAFNISKDNSVFVAVDTSASMSGTHVTEHLTCADVACLFGSMIKKAYHPANVVAVATSCQPVNLVAQEDIFTMSRKIAQTDVGFGTYFGKIMKYYNGEKYVILITDSEQADNLEGRWLKEKKRPKGSKLIVWQLQPYRIKISQDPSVVYIRGYSDRNLGLIKQIIESDGDQIAEIEKIEL